MSTLPRSIVDAFTCPSVRMTLVAIIGWETVHYIDYFPGTGDRNRQLRIYFPGVARGIICDELTNVIEQARQKLVCERQFLISFRRVGLVDFLGSGFL